MIVIGVHKRWKLDVASHDLTVHSMNVLAPVSTLSKSPRLNPRAGRVL